MNMWRVALLFTLPITTVSLADSRPDSHAPINVMGDHLHDRGEFMFSYRFMHMRMEGNRSGTSNLSANRIVTSESNPFANPPMMPPTLRVVPTEMTMDMHMFGMMYAPSDRVTLMGMLNFVEKEMDHTTYAGASGTSVLGQFTTRTSGIGDTTVSALIKLGQGDVQKFHATVGLSLPTGDIEETDQVLTPMNTRPTLRLPYPMQLGSGTYDLITGITYSSASDSWGWGGQWRSVTRLGESDENYTLGDEHRMQGWISYLVRPNLSLSARVDVFDRGNIDGSDPLIRVPVQTADPDRQGLTKVDLGIGANLLLPDSRHRLGIDVAFPVSQDLDGPQLETDWRVVLGWQFAP